MVMGNILFKEEGERDVLFDAHGSSADYSKGDYITFKGSKYKIVAKEHNFSWRSFSNTYKSNIIIYLDLIESQD